VILVTAVELSSTRNAQLEADSTISSQKGAQAPLPYACLGWGNQGFETFCSALSYTKLVLFPFCPPLPKTTYVSVQNTCILPIPGLDQKQAGKISSEAAQAKLTNPQVHLLKGENL